MVTSASQQSERPLMMTRPRGRACGPAVRAWLICLTPVGRRDYPLSSAVDGRVNAGEETTWGGCSSRTGARLTARRI
jgi:hypothetical protein